MWCKNSKKKYKIIWIYISISSFKYCGSFCLNTCEVHLKIDYFIINNYCIWNLYYCNILGEMSITYPYGPSNNPLKDFTAMVPILHV